MAKLPVIQIDPEEMAREMSKLYGELKRSDLPPDDPGLTMEEFAKHEGISLTKAKGIIGRLKEEGKIIEGRKTQINKAGRPYSAPVYRLQEKGGE